MNRRVIIILSFIFAFTLAAFSQKQVRKELRDGNNEYRQKKYTEAEIAYRKALAANAHSTDAAYNLGNALYKQEKFPDAMAQYQAAGAEEKDKERAAATWHNTGNVFMKNKEYEKSIEAYKQALRRVPQDDETRYNLALAQKLLQNQQQQNKDQNKDKNKDQNKKDQQQKQDQNKDQQQKQDQQQQQQNQDQMQQQNADQILNAMMQNERETQEKVKQQQIQQQKQRKTGKNW